MKKKGDFMRLVIAQRWRRRIKRWGRDRELITTNLLRRNMTMLSNTFNELMVERSYAILKPFLQQNIDLEKMRITVRGFYDSIQYMQRRIRASLQTKENKVEVLLNYWDKLFSQIQFKSSKLKDEATNDMCKKIIVVPKAIKRAALAGYVDKCKEIHAIAFLQWRKKFPSELRYDADEIDELLTSRIRNLHNGFKPNQKVTVATKEKTVVAKDFHKQYKLVTKKKEPFIV